MVSAKIITVKLTPKASSDRIGGTRISTKGEEVLLVYVTAQPDKNKANESMLRLLSTHFEVPVSELTIVRGQTSRNKIVRIG